MGARWGGPDRRRTPRTETGLTREAWDVARRRAAEDVALLERLVREGRVRRGEPPEGLRDEHRILRRQVEELNRPAINLAIRPKKRKRR